VIDEREYELRMKTLEEKNKELERAVQKIPEQEVRVKQLEEFNKSLDRNVRDLEQRVAAHDTAFARIEVLMENMKSMWTQLDMDIRSLIHRNQQDNTSAWKEVTLEAIKTIAIVAGSILAAKYMMK
jgi:predicted nuclease with TOPRIM domain